MDRKVWIIGAGGFAFDLASRFVQTPGEGNCFSGFIDSRIDVLEETKRICEKYKDRMNVEFLHPKDFNFADPQHRYIYGIGDAVYKKQFFSEHGLNFDQLHRFEQSPIISEYSQVGNGVFWYCNIASDVNCGHGTFIDAYSVIGHGVQIGNFCHIALNVIVGGDVIIEDACYIHSGAIIGNKVTIGEGSVVGAGAIVLRDLAPGSKVIAPKSATL